MTKTAEPELGIFLKKVHDVLPEFVVQNDERTREILDRVKEDIISMAARKAGGTDNIDLQHIEEVIAEIEDVQKFADSYLERGTPRFYITKELTPTYFRVMFLAGGAILLITLILQLMKIGHEPASKIAGYIISGFFTAAVSVFSFVTLVFALLSKLGFFPEDFRRIKRKTRETAFDRSRCAREQIAKEWEAIQRERQKEMEKGPRPNETDTQTGEFVADWKKKREERICKREERRRKDQEKRDEIRAKIQRTIEKERLERELKEEKGRRGGRVGEIVGSIFGTLFGFYLIVQYPFGILNMCNPLFLSWLRIFGGLIVFRNVWKGIQALIPFDRIWARRIVYALNELTSLLSIPLFLWIRDNILVVPAFSRTPQGLVPREPSVIATEVLFWVFTGLIVLTAIGAVVGFIKSMAMKKSKFI